MGMLGGQSGIWKALATHFKINGEARNGGLWGSWVTRVAFGSLGHSEGQRGSTRGGADGIPFCSYFLLFLPPRREGHIFTVYTPNNINGTCRFFLFVLTVWGPPSLSVVQIADNRGFYPRALMPIIWTLDFLAPPSVSGHPGPPPSARNAVLFASCARTPCGASWATTGGLIAKSIWEIPRGIPRTALRPS